MVMTQSCCCATASASRNSSLRTCRDQKDKNKKGYAGVFKRLRHNGGSDLDLQGSSQVNQAV
jgi:hypothetical protein